MTRTGNLGATLSVVLSSPGGHEVAPFSETVTFGPNVLSTTVSVPIANDGQPGESHDRHPAFALLSRRRRDPRRDRVRQPGHRRHNNPPFVTITSLQPSTIKVGTGKKAKKESVSNSSSAARSMAPGAWGSMCSSLGKTKKHKTTYTTRVPLTSAAYNYPGTPPNSVTLFLKNKPKLSASEQLTVNAGAITDSYGRPLGQNFVVTFSNRGVNDPVVHAIIVRTVSAIAVNHRRSVFRIDRSALWITKIANRPQRPAFASSSAARYSARFSTSMIVCG